MNQTHARLTPALKELPAHTGLVVALSGGLDSTVLLSLLVQMQIKKQLNTSLRALHINHRLLPAAESFETHCRQLCKNWQVPLTVKQVTVNTKGSAGREGEARTARYEAFKQNLQNDEVLLLAHHRDDQMETFLLRLMRGAGPRGLAAMPALRKLDKGWLARPLLHADRKELLSHAKAAELVWVEDPGNSDETLDRNYCRYTILPALAERWPGYKESWNKTITLADEAESLLQNLAQQDLQTAMNLHNKNQQEKNSQGKNPSLPLAHIRTLPPARQRNTLRLFLHQAGLPDPGWNKLQELANNLIPPTTTNHAELKLGNHTLTLHRDQLHIVPLMPPINSDQHLSWNPSQSNTLQLPNNGQLKAIPATGKGLAQTKTEFHIAYRQGGETCKLTNRPSKTLKQLLQESDFPPWLRPRLPLLYEHNKLACIPNIGTAEEFAAQPNTSGWLIHWQPPTG
ncbi:MAG: tRNA lysidine(34) synthetase TilS [Pseudohongiellaceae bacterium]